jgi:hypothetical protein
MANDNRSARTDSSAILLAPGMPSEADGFLDGAALWLTGGASLLLWTALALLLTSA